MKKILLSLAALLCAGSMWAQTDVTSTYLTNPGFEDCTPYTGNIVAADATDRNVDYASNGWTASAGVTWSSAAVVAYGGEGQVNGVSAPSADNNGNSGNALGVSVGWGGTITYKSASVSLPAGYYILSVNAYNNFSDAAQFASKLGFVTESASYISTSPSYPYGSWVKDEVAFYLSEAKEGYFQIGGTAVSGGSGANAKVFFDNLTLTYSEKQMDYTSSVSSTGWLKGDDTSSGTATGNGVALREYYDSSSAGTKLYEKVSGLKNGFYKVVLYATSHNARGEGGATLNGTRDDVAYVYATSSEGTKKTYITASGETPGFLTTEPIQAVISDVEVKDGNLTLGLGLDESNITGWHTIQIKSLTRTAGLDLSGYISAYETALSNAKTKAATTEKISATVLAALNTTITNYDEGKVDEEDADAMETATTALINATNAANTSIASYAVIASGTVSTSSLDGWTCTNSNTFHINTWSTEGNSDGSNMTTPFIENWVGKGTYLGEGTFSYTLEGLEPGEVYYAQALIRSYNEANSDAPNGPNFFINDTDIDLTEAGTTFTYNNMSGIYATLGGAATVGVDGKLTLGAKIASNANYNWVAFKNVSIQSMDNAFNAAVAKVTALEGTIPTAAYNTAYAVVTANSGANYPTTAAGFETAIAAIEAAATSASVFVAPYASFQTLKTSANALVSVENNNSDANSTLASAISAQNTAVEAATTAAAITTATSTLKTAMITYVGTADPAEGKLFDLSFLLTNPSFEGFADWGAPADQGWATDIPRTNLGDYNNFVCRTTGAPGGSLVSKFVERYTSNACTTANLYALYQTINLPAGNYRFEALSYANEATTVLMAAGDATGDAVTATTLNTTYKVNFTVTTAGGTKMGIKLGNDNISNWQCIASPALYKTDATKSTVTVSEAGFATYVSNYNLNFSATAIEAYAVTVTKKGVATLTKLNQVPAGTPVLLYAEGGKTEDIPVLASAEAVTDNDLVAGTGAAVATIDGEYTNMILNKVDGNVGFYFAAGQTVAANRAYLHIATTLAPDAEAGAPMVIEFADEVTGIEAVEAETSASGIYNLAGQRVAKAQKGLYIVNGKKVIVK